MCLNCILYFITINTMTKLSHKALILFSILSLSSPSVFACINTYAFELGRGLSKEEIKAKLAENLKKPYKTVAQQNDYAVILIYDGQYKKAIQLLTQLEKQHPNLAKTAANLGTAYELDGQIEKAKYWILQGLKRDPNIHHGSEWIHIKILDAELAIQKQPDWLKNHDVLGLDFGKKAAPIAHIEKISFNQKKYDLDQVLEHSKIQMDQRLKFVNKDPISAQIVFNMANIEVVQYSNEQDTPIFLYDMAGDLNYQNPKLIHERKDYLQYSKWYKFKSFTIQIARGISNLFSHLISEIKQKV